MLTPQEGMRKSESGRKWGTRSLVIGCHLIDTRFLSWTHAPSFRGRAHAVLSASATEPWQSPSARQTERQRDSLACSRIYATKALARTRHIPANPSTNADTRPHESVRCRKYSSPPRPFPLTRMHMPSRSRTFVESVPPPAPRLPTPLHALLPGPASVIKVSRATPAVHEALGECEEELRKPIAQMAQIGRYD